MLTSIRKDKNMYEQLHHTDEELNQTVAQSGRHVLFLSAAGVVIVKQLNPLFKILKISLQLLQIGLMQTVMITSTLLRVTTCEASHLLFYLKMEKKFLVSVMVSA